MALKGSLSGYRDSNSGPPTPEAGALTGLRYIPKTCRTEIVPKHRTGTPPVKELPFSDRRGNKIRTCDPLLPKAGALTGLRHTPRSFETNFPIDFGVQRYTLFGYYKLFGKKIVLPVGCRRRAVRNRLSSSAPYSCRAKPRPETVQRWKRIVKRRIRRVTKSGM